MSRDPACGMEVDEALAQHTSSYKGKTYYFCSASCKKAFDQAPEKYVRDEPPSKSKRETS